jgi:hypothetical protein
MKVTSLFLGWYMLGSFVHDQQLQSPRHEPQVILTSIQPQQEASPSAVVKGYLRWYLKHRIEAGYLNIIPNHPGDTSRNYAVSVSGLESYLQKLKSSGYVTKDYINQLRIYYNKVQSQLQDYPQSDGPIPGFEVDPVLQVMEEDEIANNLNHFVVLKGSRQYNHCYLYGRLSSLLFIKSVMTWEKGHWKIDALNFTFNT